MEMKRFFAVLAMCLLFVGTVHAATITTFVDGQQEYGGGSNEVFVIHNRVDFADIANYPDGGVTTADVVQLLRVPANMVVTEVGARVVDDGSLSGTTDWSGSIGDGALATRFINPFEIANSASGVSYSLATGMYYSAADTIDLTVPTLTNGYLAKAAGGTQRPISAVTDFVMEVWAKGYILPGMKTYGKLR
jgi:hypothetical protein